MSPEANAREGLQRAIWSRRHSELRQSRHVAMLGVFLWRNGQFSMKNGSKMAQNGLKRLKSRAIEGILELRSAISEAEDAGVDEEEAMEARPSGS